MPEPPEPQDDEVLADLYRHETPEPPEALDREIRAAAAAALAPSAPRRWRYPVGVGAAAAAVLVALLLVPHPDVRDAIEPAPRADDLALAPKAPETPRVHPATAPATAEVTAATASNAAEPPAAPGPMAPAETAGRVRRELAAHPPAIAPPALARDDADETPDAAWCGAPAAIEGPFATMPGVTRLWVCSTGGLAIRAEGGGCTETFRRPGGSVMREPAGTGILVVYDATTYALGCADRSWVLNRRP